MKLTSLITVGLLLFSSSLSVEATSFPMYLSHEEKHKFIKKIDKLEKRFKITKSLKDISDRVHHGRKHPHPIVQVHSDGGNINNSGGLIRESIYAKYFNLYFTYEDAQDIVAGFAFQLFNDLFLYNAEDCTFWSFDSFSDMVNAFLLIVEDNKPDESVLSFAYSLHKAPLAYYTCSPIISDYANVVNFYSQLSQAPEFWGKIFVDILWNITFNWVDLIYEWVTFQKSFEERNWTMTGTYMAKMMSDICFKAPFDFYNWNYKNSDVLNS